MARSGRLLPIELRRPCGPRAFTGLFDFHDKRIRQRKGHPNEIATSVYPPKLDADLNTLADSIIALVEGGIILSKSLKDKNALPTPIKMLFEP